MKIEQRIAELGLTLPEVKPPLFRYAPAVEFQNMVFISGQVARINGKSPYTGRVPDVVSEEEAKECARICTLQALAWVKNTIGDLDRVERVVKVTGFVNSAPDFGSQPSIIDACSSMLFDIFGEAGLHARAAVGMAALPGLVPVEIEFIFGIRAR